MREHDSTAVRGKAIALSSLILDPLVRAAFERAERDDGNTYAVLTEPKPILIGGAAAVIDSLNTRMAIEAHIERMIAMLDTFDGDENLEPYIADQYPEYGDLEGDEEREQDSGEGGIGDMDGLIEQAGGIGYGWAV